MNNESVLEYQDYRNFLRDELERRMDRNSRFSLRGFARLLGVAPSTLSEVLKGKHGLSIATARRIGLGLGLSDCETSHWLRLFNHEENPRPIASESVNILKTVKRGRSPIRAHLISPARVASLGQWYDYALIEALKIVASPTVEKLSRLFGIQNVLVKSSLLRLEGAGMIRSTSRGWKVLKRLSRTTHDIPSSTIRGLHRQFLAKANQALDDQPIQDRCFHSVVVSVPKHRIAEFREKLHQFRNDFMEEHHETPDVNSIYCLTLGFFELSKEEIKNEI